MDLRGPVSFPITGSGSPRSDPSRHVLSCSPLAEQALADDIAACSEDDVDSNADADALESAHGHSMYRRLSGVAYGNARPVFNSQHLEEPILTRSERKRLQNAERSLLRDNRVLPPKYPEHQKSQTLPARLYRRLFSTKLPPRGDDQAVATTERPPLLRGAYGRRDGPDAESTSIPSDDLLEEQWEEVVASGRLRSTWQREAKTVVSYSAPLIITFCLQYSINVASIFAVGHLGQIELGAVSLVNMSDAISCLAPFQGLATSLDTLCAQAYGSGHKHLVGLQCQRLAAFLFCLSTPVVVLWLLSDRILVHIVPDPESARLAGLYLKISVFAIPGIILFETGKRFLQAQGLFRATTAILLIVAPVNAFLTWLLVWKLEMGFVSAPIAVAIAENLLPVFLVLYIKFVGGFQCWGGFSKRAFSNWWVMVRLALPGMIMVKVEWLAFEIMTLFASRFGTEYLAAQSVLATLATISYQIPFQVSIAASTRVANLIGAGMVDAAKVTARVQTFVAVCGLGLVNLTVYSTLRYHLPTIFTGDSDVIALCAEVLPLVAIVQVFDGFTTGAHGLLRGIGKQSIGGPAKLISYYVISLPISLALAFGAGWKLQGMWVGVTVVLVTISLIEYSFLLRTDWHKAAAEAAVRNAAG